MTAEAKQPEVKVSEVKVARMGVKAKLTRNQRRRLRQRVERGNQKARKAQADKISQKKEARLQRAAEALHRVAARWSREQVEKMMRLDPSWAARVIRRGSRGG